MAKAQGGARKIAKKPAARAASDRTAPRAAASRPLHAVRFPNESPGYRAARNELLEAEIRLRQRIEQVAALRRKLPLGGAAKEDYVFEEGETMLSGHPVARRVRLSELFGEHDSLVVYNFMYGPDMQQPCPMCASILDSLDGAAPHIGQRTSLVVVARSPIARIRQLALSRGWRRLRFLSSSQNDYNRDYHGETADGAQMPMLNVFVRRNGKVHHFTGTELLYAPRESGQGHRHVDLIWPLWNVLDLTPEGRGTDWTPQLSYID